MCICILQKAMHNTLSNTYTIDLKLTFISFIHSLLYETTHYNVFGEASHAFDKGRGSTFPVIISCLNSPL